MPKKPTTKNSPTKKSVSRVGQTSRRLKQPQYKRFRYSKRIKHTGPKLPNVAKLFIRSLLVIKKDWRIFGSIMLIYAILSLVFVHGTTGSIGVSDTKNAFDQVFKGTGALGQLTSGVAVFGVLLGSSNGNNAQLAGVYQSVLFIIISLVIIWTLRQAHNKKRAVLIPVRDAFYKSMHPLIPFVLLMILILVQLIPMFIGGAVYNMVIANQLAVGFGEKAVWLSVFFGLAVLSFYWLSATLIGLYIVTLPDMTPLRAVRSARELVRYRRWTVMRKILFLPLILLIFAALIMIPAIIFVTPIAEWLFMIMGVVGLAVTHSYMYTLYRELL
jgi:hypothetical protein